MNTIETINEMLSNTNFDKIGLRVMTGGAIVNVGDNMANSMVWVDGEMTSEELDGVSCLDLKFDGYEINEKTFVKMMNQAAAYGLQNQIVIVGGMTADSYEGNDMNEVVIANAVCLMVIKDASA